MLVQKRELRKPGHLCRIFRLFRGCVFFLKNSAGFADKDDSRCAVESWIEETASMFESHFGMKHRPFRSAPDTDRYYPASGHEQVLARLLQTLRDERGIAVLCGPAGTGKTLLCHCLLERLEAGVATVFLTNSHFANRAGLLQAILYDLGQPYQGMTEQELRLAVTE